MDVYFITGLGLVLVLPEMSVESLLKIKLYCNRTPGVSILKDLTAALVPTVNATSLLAIHSPFYLFGRDMIWRGDHCLTFQTSHRRSILW